MQRERSVHPQQLLSLILPKTNELNLYLYAILELWFIYTSGPSTYSLIPDLRIIYVTVSRCAC